MIIILYYLQVDIYCFGLFMFQFISNGHAPFEELTPYERDRAVVEVNHKLFNPLKSNTEKHV